jgi:hypothetical protein
MNIYRDIPLSSEQITDEFNVKSRRMNSALIAFLCIIIKIENNTFLFMISLSQYQIPTHATGAQGSSGSNVRERTK